MKTLDGADPEDGVWSTLCSLVDYASLLHVFLDFNGTGMAEVRTTIKQQVQHDTR